MAIRAAGVPVQIPSNGRNDRESRITEQKRAGLNVVVAAVRSHYLNIASSSSGYFGVRNDRVCGGNYKSRVV